MAILLFISKRSMSYNEGIPFPLKNQLPYTDIDIVVNFHQTRKKSVCSDQNCLTRAQVRGHSSEVWEHGMTVARWTSFCEGGGSRGKQHMQRRQSERK